nr:tetraacyldisaccharide 4'-kinase [Granulicella aggregans]
MPLVPLYAGVVTTKRWLHDRGILGQRRLGHPVISVGSLSAGGAGKTPVVLLLAELLGARGFEVRILTRGYGRVGKLTEQVDPRGDAARFGDEPLLLARRAPGAKIFVGRDRYRAGMLAEHNEPAETRAIYILDDGFQHQKLAREVEVLLITRQDFEDRLLPAGNLREPLRAISRADFVVLREDERELEKILSFALPPVLTIRRNLEVVNGPGNPSRPIVFSGLARPEGFFAMLAHAGIDIVVTETFPDHHRYSAGDIERLVRSARQTGADGFVTTEKDAVKLSPAMMDRLRSIGPVVVAPLEVELLDEASAIDVILARLASQVS